MKTLFWGSSEVSVPFLELLFKNKIVDLLGIITRQDKPSGRGLKLEPTPVKILAEKLFSCHSRENGNPQNKLKRESIFTPENIQSSEFFDFIKSLNPDLSIVVSYGKIIPEEIINLHKLGMLNIHFSLLPKYRGAAPIQWALINGEKITGVTIFWLDKGMDTGDIFLQKQVEVSDEDDYFTLSDKLINLGCEMLGECIIKLNDVILNKVKNLNKDFKIPQSGIPSFAPIIKKQQGKIDWNKTASEIHNLVRGLVQWPKASTSIKFGTKICNLKILKTKTIINHRLTFTPLDNFISNGAGINSDLEQDKKIKEGTILNINSNSITVQCGNNTQLKILQLQPENKRVMNTKEFLCGHKIKIGDKFI